MSRAAALPRAGAGVHVRVEPRSRLGSGWESPVLLLVTLVLLSIGLVTVYSASAVKAAQEGLPDYYYVAHQALGGALGLLVLVAMARLDYDWLRWAAWLLLLGLIAALVVVVLPGTESFSPVRNGARRWIYIGTVSFQPSEFAKLVLVIWTAALAVRKQEQLRSLTRGLLPFLLVWGLVFGLIFLQPSMSAGMLVVLLSVLVLFAGGARLGHFLLLGVLALPVLWAQVDGVAYRMRRVTAYLDPAHDPVDGSYQIFQSLIALGSGGLMGRGFGHGHQKFGFLPEPHNDFLFAMIGEEWGLVGTAMLIVLFTAIALIGYRIARNAPDPFAALLAVGVTNLIVVQAFLHMAVNLALLPTTGVTLPFMSYGRSSLLVCMAAVGILMGIARMSQRREA